MTYLADSAHTQLCGLWLGCVGWTLTCVALGLVQWRVWLVPDSPVISSGEAWVGVWRVCFHSHTLVSPGFRVLHCSSMGLTEAFTPPEVTAAQVLMLVALLAGLCGNACGLYALRDACGLYALRDACFGLQRRSQVRLAFLSSGALCLLAAGTSSIPLLWNLTSVVSNQTIRFPAGFHLPPAPDSQQVGCGIWVGVVGTGLMLLSGVIFCMYRSPERSPHLDGSSPAAAVADGKDNPAFEAHDYV